MLRTLRIAGWCVSVFLGAFDYGTANDWTINSPNHNEQFSRDADISVLGTGPASTSGVGKLLKGTVTQDSFTFTTKDAEDPNSGEFDGEFNIDGQWDVGFHSIWIWSGNPSQIVAPLPPQQTPRNVEIVN